MLAADLWKCFRRSFQVFAQVNKLESLEVGKVGLPPLFFLSMLTKFSRQSFVSGTDLIPNITPSFLRSSPSPFLLRQSAYRYDRFLL